MNEDQIKQLVRQELAEILGILLKSDRYTFSKAIQILDGRNIQLGTGTGTRIGTSGGSSGQRLSFFNEVPIVQWATTGEAGGFTQDGGTTVNHLSSFTGGTGTIAFNISDVVRGLKLLGLFDA